ncbi:amidohydrolase [Sporobolomyces salmoneus]|uniref:amidohydrolase n=1 Tax=Sporobolomyces salmoneus TaxID=183962 RepID=UPI00317A51FD
MRRRRQPSDSTTPVAQPIETPEAPKGKAFPTRQRFISPRLRQLAFVIPCVLLALYLFSRSTSTPSLGSHYAVCTRERDGVITMSKDSPLRTQCLVVANGKIGGTGTIEEVRKKWGDRDTTGNDGIKIVWMKKGETVLPGLIDAHAHVLQNGEAATSVNLVGSTSIKEVRDRIVRFIEASPTLKSDKSQFILGLGWDQTKFTDLHDGEFPTAADLDIDPRLRGRPIILKRVDAHALWVPEKILELLPPSLPDKIAGGSIIRVDGKPTGVFLDNAMSLVNAVIPPWNDHRRLSYLRATSRQMLKHGLTSVHDAALTLSDIGFLKKIDREDMLPIRIWGMLSCENPLNYFCGDDERSKMYDGNKFYLKAVKLFVDGALGSWGSAMTEPYSDKPESRGILICDKEELNEVVRKWVERGYQVNSHGIGDLANTLILSAYDLVLSNSSLPSYSHAPDSRNWTMRNPLRLRIEHAQILRVEDIEWMGKMGIVASFQPTHATSDMDYVETRIGPERVKGAYAWRKIISSGAPYALGSDFPVESVDPFLGIYAAITRKYSPSSSSGGKIGSPHGSDQGWYETERLTPLEALRGFTSNAAKASFQEERVGMLKEGMEADFVVVRDGDVLELGEKKEGETREEMRERERRLGTIGERVKATIVSGRVMYGSLT